MSWRPVKSIVHAVCTHRFEPTDSDDLALEIGDDVYITEIGGPTQEWCRGWLLSQPSILSGLSLEPGNQLKPRSYSGIFPSTHVEIREVLGDEPATSPIAHASHQLSDGDTVSGASRATNRSPGPGTEDSDRLRSASRTRSIRQTRLFHRRRSDAQIEPMDVMPRSPDAPREKAPIPAMKIGDATEFSVEEPLVDEISSCLREWYSTKLHDLVLAHEYDVLDKVSTLVRSLDNARKQLIHDLLTEKELSELRENTIWELVDGNKMMDGGVIVRSPRDKGRILTAQDNIPEMLRLQAMMTLRERTPPTPLQESVVSHVLAEIKHFPEAPGENGILHMYLCRQTGDGKPTPVSEVYAVEMPLDLQGPGALVPNQLPRTLFTDLTKAEVGSATDPSTRLYLVCLLQRDEPFRADAAQTPPIPSLPQSERPEQSSHGENVNGGRRSFLFGAQRGRRQSQDQLRPVTGESARSKLPKQHAYTPTSVADSHSRPSTGEKRVRRTVGYCAIELGALVRQQNHSEVSLAMWAPAHPFDEVFEQQRPGEDGWEDVLKSLVRSPTEHFSKLDSVGHFKLYLHAFAHADAQALITDHPALLRDTHCTQALTFSSSSKQPRNDIYLTLREPIFPPGARCFHPQEGSVPVAADTGLRNLQLTLEVRTDCGRRIENAIFPTSNRPAHTAYRSPAIDRGEAWNQTIRLSIPTKDLREAHVVLSIADGSNFPFALSWLPLWNAARDSCPQGPQILALWDYSEYTASTLQGRGAYQSLPSHLGQLQAQDKSAMASLITVVTVTSSVEAQDPNVAALLNWDGNTVEGLMEALESFKLAPDSEIIKFFKPILAILDRIFDTFYGLTDDAGAMIGELFAERALSCLVHALHLTHDRRYSSSKDVLEEYIIEREVSPNALKAVARAFRSMLGRPYEVEEARELRSALKVSGQIIKFTTNNHRNALRQATPTIANPMTSVQNAALNLMRNPREAVYGTQVILMQNYASWLPELLPVSTLEEVLEFVEDMMTASSSKKGSLRITRLVMLNQLSSLDMFKSKEIRPQVLLKTSEWLQPYWFTSEIVTEHQLDSIRMCCSIIESQQSDMTLQSLHYIIKLFEAYHLLEGQLQNQDYGRTSRMSQVRGKKTFSMPFPKSYPFHATAVEASSVPKEALVEIATLLTSFFQKGPPLGELKEHLMGAEHDDVLEMFLTRALQVLRSIQDGKAFPPQWLSVYISHAKCSVTMTQWILDLLLVNFLPLDDAADFMSFNDEIWELWFKTLIDLSLNKTVSMENFSEQTSRAIWTIGGDIRESVALLLRYGWESLGWKVTPEYERAILPMTRMGGFQVGLTAKLIPSAVRLCMGMHSGLRSVGLDMLRSMIISEWQLNEDLELVQGAFFDAFDMIAQQDGPLGKNFTSAFLDDLRQHFMLLQNTTEAPLYDAVVQMIKEVEKLLRVLGELTIVKDPGSQLIQLFHLTDFLRLSGKDDAYIRRIHELSHTHAQTRNYSSAAFTVQMHINILDRDKSDERGLRVLPQVNLSGLELPEESMHARKSKLFRLMMTYYEKGHCWENVLDVLKQHTDASRAVWDISALADIADEKSRVYRLLAKGPKYTPRYFYVAFSDHSAFPALVRGKQYIFEGPADCDRRSFCQLLHAQFPSAVNLGPEYAHPDTQSQDPTVKISAVTPYKDHLHPINQQSGVASQYKEHCLTAKPRTFAITSRHDVPQVSITDQTVEKTIYSTREPFPTLLSYSQIVGETRTTLSPLQAAIDRTQRKTQILSVAAERVAAKGEAELDALLDTVRSSVNPDASGSVVEYHRLLMGPPESSDSDTANSIPQTVDGAASEEVLLRRALSVALEDHARCIESALASPLISSSTKVQLRTFFQAAFVLELHTIYPGGDWQKKSPAWVDSIRESTTSARQRNGASEVTAEADQMETRRKQSNGRRSSLRKRLSFLSIGGKSII